MKGISISPIELLIIGAPEGFLFVLALYIFTRTKIKPINFIIQSIIIIVVTYGLRWLPINLGVHTMLTLLALIILFLAVNKVSLQKLISAITSVVIIAIIIVISEVLNVLILDAIYGVKISESLLNSKVPLTKSVSEIPSNVIFGLVILIYYFVLKQIDKKKKANNGEISEETGE